MQKKINNLGADKSFRQKICRFQKLEDFFREQNKNSRKIAFAYVSEHCASFGTKISIWPLLEVGGGGEEGLQVVK